MSSKVDLNSTSSHSRIGQTNGLENEVNEGLIDEDESSTVKEMGQDKIMHGITSMDVQFSRVANPRARAEIATENIPKANLKTWKRMARRPSETGVHNRIINSRERVPGDQMEDENPQSLKKSKIVAGTQPSYGDILAMAIKQPRQQP